tara:strand:+ start:20114 stop:20764 length:651 start_codon:yes stop_codon:yes gene_type:complete
MLRNYLPYFLIVATTCLMLGLPKLSTKISSPQVNGKMTDKEAPEFSLRTTKKTTFNNSNLKNKWTLLTFGFSKCNGICPLNLSKLGVLIDSIKETDASRLKDLQFVFISIDKERDNPKSLEDFTSNFSKLIIPLSDGDDTGPIVSKRFNSYINKQKNKQPDYQISHAGFIYLIDPNSRIKIIYTNEEVASEEILSDLKFLGRQYGTGIRKTRLSSM